jgi:uncharacterized protein involved in exopolysaccharide biosynthesis
MKTSEIEAAERAAVDERVAGLELPGDERSRPDFLALLLTLTRRKKIILQVTIAVAVLAAIVSLILPKTYTAMTVILPPQQNQSAASALVGQIGLLGGLSSSDLGLKNPDDLFIAMLNSRTVEDHLIDRFDLLRVYGVKRYQARKKLENNSYVVAEREGTISVSVTDRDPKRAAAMANAYVDELRSLNQNLAVSEASQRRLFYQQKLDAEREDLSKAELALEQAQEKSGLIQPQAQGQAIIDAVGTAQAQVAAKEVQIESMRTYATASNPDLKRAEQELAGLREQLTRLERSKGALGNGEMAIPTRRLPEVELEYLRRARDLKYHESLYEFLGKQLEAARIDEAKEAVVVQVLDKAVEPERKSGPRRLLIVLVSAFVAFVVMCLWVLLAEGWRRKEQDPREHLRLAELRASFKRP